MKTETIGELVKNLFAEAVGTGDVPLQEPEVLRLRICDAFDRGLHVVQDGIDGPAGLPHPGEVLKGILLARQEELEPIDVGEVV